MLRSLSLGLGVALICWSGASWANENSNNKLNNWYLGGSVGSLKADLDGARSFQSDGRVSGINLGYDFSNWFGLEFEYNRTNSIDEYLDVSATPNSSAWISSVEYESYGLYPTFSWEIAKRIELFGRIGYSKINYQETVKTQSMLIGRTFENSSSDYGFGYSVGLKYLFRSNVECRLLFSSISGSFDVDDNQGGNEEAEVKLENLSVGIAYRFN